jgi:tetratricopeptide (TPR) repeat protein
VRARANFARPAALLRKGDAAGAERVCRELLSEHPKDAHALALLARIAGHPERADEALGLARAAVAADDACAEGHDTLGHLLMLAGRHAEAIVTLTRAVELDPRSAETRNHLGLAYAAARCPAPARGEFEAAIRLRPDYAEARRNLATLLQAEGETGDAIQVLRRAIEAEPNDPGWRRWLATLLTESQRPQDAAAELEEALARVPRDDETATALVRTFLSLGRLDEALSLSEAVTARSPDDAEALFALGNVLLRLARPADALECYQRALALQPDSARGRFALASPLLMLGRYSEGWAAYEARLWMPGLRWKVHAPRDRLWEGGPLEDRHLLVHAEQGFGDTFQFVRYLPLLRAREGAEARIDLLCEPEIARVLGTVRGLDAVLAPEVIDRPEYDVQVPLLSLPHRVGTTLETIPAQGPYIGLPEGTSARVPRPPGTRLAVALAWAGRPTHSDDRMRSCPLGELAALFELDDVLFVSVQMGAPRAQLEPYLARGNVIDASSSLGDFAETVAVLDQVDLLISVDTSVVHLAGAFGKPVWTLLAFGGEWRWLTERDDTPWYPTMRLFRQRRPGEWAHVLDRVLDALQRRLAEI